MTPVATDDLSAIIGVGEQLLDCRSPVAFASAAERALAGLIPCEYAVLRWLERPAEPIYTCLSPDRMMSAEGARYFNDLATKQHPLATYYERTADPRTRRLSDVATLTELHRTDVYNEFLRPSGIDRQMGAIVPARHAAMVGCMVGRGGRDFSDRDAVVMELLRPQLANAFDGMMLRVALTAALEAQDAALASAGRALLLLSRSGRVMWRSASAERWLQRYFPAERQDALPERVAAWLTARRDESGCLPVAGATAPERLCVAGADGVLSLRWLPAVTTEWDALILEEQREAQIPAPPVDFTPREWRVLRAMADGLDDREIGATLAISVRTVQKHREHIYAKLGVQTRTAAVLYALRCEHSLPRFA